MKRAKQLFYSGILASDATDSREGFLFRSLKRFENFREDVVYGLLPSGGRLLDVGCGGGRLVCMARDKFGEVHGVDLLEIQSHRAKSRAKGVEPTNVNFVCADVDDGLPYDACYFDTVVCVTALEYFFDPYFAMSEFDRVLKKEGILIVEVPNIAYLPYRLKLLLGVLPTVSSNSYGWDGGVLHYFTMSSLCQLFADSGFKVVKKTGSGIFAKWRNWWPSLLTGDLIVKGIKL